MFYFEDVSDLDIELSLVSEEVKFFILNIVFEIEIEDEFIYFIFEFYDFVDINKEKN